MNAKQRLDREERKQQIIESVLPLFSQKGINSVTSKEMAKAAGVSEALIYKYFPQKRDIYQSVFQSVCTEMTAQLATLNNLKPSFTALNIFMKKLLEHFIDTEAMNRFLPKIIMRSIIEDGEFAAYFLENVDQRAASFFTRCLETCLHEGLLRVEDPPKQDMGFWLIHHACVMLRFITQSPRQLINYRLNPQEVKGEIYKFCMRGIGFTDEAVAEGWNNLAQLDFETLRRVG